MKSAENTPGLSPDSSRLLGRIQEQIEELIPVEVPEWSKDGEQYLVYMKHLTLPQVRDIKRKHGGDEAELNLFTVLRNACDKNGDRLFDESARMVLIKAPAAIMVRLATAAMAGADLEDATEQAAVKN